MGSASISMDIQSSMNFSEYRLFIIDNAMASGAERLYIKRENDNLEIRIGGKDESVRAFYDSLIETLENYGACETAKLSPFHGYIPPIDLYQRYAILVEANEYADSLEKVNSRIKEKLNEISEKYAAA